MPPGPLNDYDRDYLICRDLRHPWVLDSWYREDGLIHRILTCPRCDTERTDVWTPFGERVTTSYVYPDGYMVDGGVERVLVRQAVMSRSTIYASREAAIQNRRRSA